MRNARIAAVLTWVYAVAFGIPAIPVAAYLLMRGSLPSFQGMFEMYGGPWSLRAHDDETFVAVLVVFFVVTLVAAWAAWLLWKGSRAGAVLSLVLLPVEAMFWFGFALPIPWLFGVARIVLVTMAWHDLVGTAGAREYGAVRTVTRGAVLTGLASGFVGVLANVFLVLFYAVDQPWQSGLSTTDYGVINDWLIPGAARPAAARRGLARSADWSARLDGHRPGRVGGRRHAASAADGGRAVVRGASRAAGRGHHRAALLDGRHQRRGGASWLALPSDDRPRAAGGVGCARRSPGVCDRRGNVGDPGRRLLGMDRRSVARSIGLALVPGVDP
ncbi:MAG TPA: hypothetical protein VIQ02_03945, partial [Jiangellaceae bacterium]